MRKFISLLLILTVAVLAVSPVAFVQAETVPTSDCVSNLTARFTYNGAANGTLTVTADVAGVANAEYVQLKINKNVSDIINNQGEMATISTPYKSANVISEGKLTLKWSIDSTKLEGMCAAYIQFLNIGEGTDWVGAWIEVPVTLKANCNDIPDETVYAPCGSSAAAWISENVGDVFSRENWKIGGWGKDADRTAIGTDVIPAAGYTAYTIWEYDGLRGDIDGDGKVTVADALEVLRIAVKLSPETYESIRICNMDSDSVLTVADALAVLRIAVKLDD